MRPETENTGWKGMCRTSSYPKRIASILLLAGQDFDVFKPSFSQCQVSESVAEVQFPVFITLDHMHQAVCVVLFMIVIFGH